MGISVQLLRIMDSVWHKCGLDLRMIPYGCCATGHDLGMIEVVKNSDTTANIQVKYGGKNLGAWKVTPIDQYLLDNNKDDNYLKSVQNFVHTCAGYCVATYVAGERALATSRGNDYSRRERNRGALVAQRGLCLPRRFAPRLALARTNLSVLFIAGMYWVSEIDTQTTS